jgi:hypothetical protein
MSAIAAENPLAPIISSSEAELIDDDNINNYNGINWKRLPDL